MAESPDSLFRRGMISGREHGRLKVLAGTKVQPSKMANFDDKAGRRDQGGIRDRGAREASREHIQDRRTQRDTSALAGRPSKGGRVAGPEGQAGVAHIDAGNFQHPPFPREGSTPRKQSVGTPKRARGRVQPSGPEYGGPNSRADG